MPLSSGPSTAQRPGQSLVQPGQLAPSCWGRQAWPGLGTGPGGPWAAKGEQTFWDAGALPQLFP